MKTFITERQKFLLEVLKNTEEIDGNTKLVKLAFITQTTKHLSHYNFIRWHYGPYASEISEDLNYLIQLGLIKTRESWLKNKSYSINSKALDRFGIQIDYDKSLKRIGAKVNAVKLKSFLENLYKYVDVNSYETGESIDTNSSRVRNGIAKLLKSM